MIDNYLIFYDFETGSADPYTTQPIQLGAVAIDPHKLQIVPDSAFSQYIQPVWDDEACQKAGLAPIDPKALDKNNILRSDLVNAPNIKVVGDMFTKYIKRYSTKSTGIFEAPVRCGFNIRNFDDVILERMATQYKAIEYNHDKHQHKIFNYQSIDLRDIITYFTFSHQLNDNNSISFDNIRTYFGIPSDGAHKALDDCVWGAMLLCKLLAYSKRNFLRIGMKDSFDESLINQGKNIIRGHAC